MKRNDEFVGDTREGGFVGLLAAAVLTMIASRGIFICISNSIEPKQDAAVPQPNGSMPVARPIILYASCYIGFDTNQLPIDENILHVSV